MSEAIHYRVKLKADEAGTRQILVFPPLEAEVAALLRESLQQRARQTNDIPKGHIMRPTEVHDPQHGEGTRFVITHIIQPSSLKWLGQSAAYFLDSFSGNPTDMTHQLELEAERLATQSIVQDAEINREYL